MYDNTTIPIRTDDRGFDHHEFVPFPIGNEHCESEEDKEWTDYALSAVRISAWPSYLREEPTDDVDYDDPTGVEIWVSFWDDIKAVPLIELLRRGFPQMSDHNRRALLRFQDALNKFVEESGNEK